jgi:hypothetical protein
MEILFLRLFLVLLLGTKRLRCNQNATSSHLDRQHRFLRPLVRFDTMGVFLVGTSTRQQQPEEPDFDTNSVSHSLFLPRFVLLALVHLLEITNLHQKSP